MILICIVDFSKLQFFIPPTAVLFDYDYLLKYLKSSLTSNHNQTARKNPQTRARCEVHQMQFFRLSGRPDVSTALHHLSHHSRALISFMASAPPALARRVSPPMAAPNPPVRRLPRFVFFLMFKLAP